MCRTVIPRLYLYMAVLIKEAASPIINYQIVLAYDKCALRTTATQHDSMLISAVYTHTHACASVFVICFDKYIYVSFKIQLNSYGHHVSYDSFRCYSAIELGQVCARMLKPPIDRWSNIPIPYEGFEINNKFLSYLQQQLLIHYNIVVDAPVRRGERPKGTIADGICRQDC